MTPEQYAKIPGLQELDATIAAKATEATSVRPIPMLKPVSVFDVLTHPSPAQQFVWDGYLPRGVVSMFSAHGGTGKSTIALMLAACTAAGLPLFGVPTHQCNALFVSLEDSAAIVRNRLAMICVKLGINPADLNGKLHVVDGTENPELFSSNSRSDGGPTSTYAELRNLVRTQHVGLVVVDNASDAYGGDEIQRRPVRAFIRSLGEIASINNSAVLLLAHVDKTTSRNRSAEGGEGYSGSTAWHNSARSRLFMTRKDDGTLTIEHQKNNLGRTMEPMTLEWLYGELPRALSLTDGDNPLALRAEGREQDEKAIALLRMIHEYEGRQQYIGTATTSRHHAYAVLKSDPAFKRLKVNQEAAKQLITQCQKAGWIEILDYRDAGRKSHTRWTLTDLGREISGVIAPTAPTAPSSEDGADVTDGARGAPTAPTCLGGVGDRARTLLTSLEVH